MKTQTNLRDWFGEIDIYLFDQLLKGRFDPKMHVLDAGCGVGRNLVYFLKEGYNVCGVDTSADSIDRVRSLANAIAPHLPNENFHLEPVERMSFDDDRFDVVISSGVLHFARDESHWRDMIVEMWRVLKPGGIFFARMAATTCLEKEVVPLGGGLYRLPDGVIWFLANELIIREVSDSLPGELIEPLKTIVVHGVRSMSVWCLRKR